MREDLKRWAGPIKAPSPEELADRYAVSQLVKVYALGVDLDDYDLTRSVFADDAQCEGTTFSGHIDEYLPQIFEGVRAFGKAQHHISNQHIVIDGDEATVWSYSLGVHKVREGDTSRQNLTIGVQYRDTCRRTPDGWLIARRGVDHFWTELTPPGS